MPGPARRTAEEVVLALTDAGFFRIFTPIRFGGYVADIRTAAMPTAPAPGRWVDTQPSRRWRRSTLCSTCTARVVSPRKTGCSSTGVMPTPRHGIPDLTPSWVARSLASHYWQSRSESARWCDCRLARALVGLDRAHARSP